MVHGIPVLTARGQGIAEAWENSLVELHRNGCRMKTMYDKSTDPASIDATMLITIEDPLEFVHPNKNCLFTQREIGSHARSFADALRVASREDPDIILVGEMRDLETIALALTCAELGILVFGTLHTNSAAKTIDRIINVFPADQQAQARTMLGESLRAVVAQQLLKTKDGKGRCAAVEILIGSRALGSIIREGKIPQINSLIQGGAELGMQTMDQNLMQLIKEGQITPEAAYEKAIDKNLFLDMMEKSPDIV